MIRRASLKEHDGLPLTDSKRKGNAVDLEIWRERDYITFDVECGVWRLKPAGRERTAECCGVCRCWKDLMQRERRGECWSADSMESAPTSPVAYTREYDVCEAFIGLEAKP
jgi:hypothetical protein